MNIKSMMKQQHLREIVSYGLVGFSVTCLNFALYYLLTRYTALHYELARSEERRVGKECAA